MRNSADLLSLLSPVDRTKNQLSHEQALRDVITSVLMEPDFLYRLDMTDGQCTQESAPMP